MSNKNKLLIFGILVVSLIFLSENVAAHGSAKHITLERIKDDSGNSLEGVSVTIGSLSKTCDAAPCILDGDIDPGTYTITGTKDGYQDGTIENFEIVSGQTEYTVSELVLGEITSDSCPEEQCASYIENYCIGGTWVAGKCDGPTEIQCCEGGTVEPKTETEVAVTVTVTDKDTGDPIAGAHFYLSISYQGFTDENGQLVLNVPPGDYRFITVEAIGYYGSDLRREIISDPLSLEFELEKNDEADPTKVKIALNIIDPDGSEETGVKVWYDGEEKSVTTLFFPFGYIVEFKVDKDEGSHIVKVVVVASGIEKTVSINNFDDALPDVLGNFKLVLEITIESPEAPEGELNNIKVECISSDCGSPPVNVMAEQPFTLKITCDYGDDFRNCESYEGLILISPNQEDYFKVFEDPFPDDPSSYSFISKSKADLQHERTTFITAILEGKSNNIDVTMRSEQFENVCPEGQCANQLNDPDCSKHGGYLYTIDNNPVTVGNCPLPSGSTDVCCNLGTQCWEKYSAGVCIKNDLSCASLDEDNSLCETPSTAVCCKDESTVRIKAGQFCDSVNNPDNYLCEGDVECPEAGICAASTPLLTIEMSNDVEFEKEVEVNLKCVVESDVRDCEGGSLTVRLSPREHIGWRIIDEGKKYGLTVLESYEAESSEIIIDLIYITPTVIYEGRKTVRLLNRKLRDVKLQIDKNKVRIGQTFTVKAICDYEKGEDKVCMDHAGITIEPGEVVLQREPESGSNGFVYLVSDDYNRQDHPKIKVTAEVEDVNIIKTDTKEITVEEAWPDCILIDNDVVEGSSGQCTCPDDTPRKYSPPALEGGVYSCAKEGATEGIDFGDCTFEGTNLRCYTPDSFPCNCPGECKANRVDATAYPSCGGFAKGENANKYVILPLGKCGECKAPSTKEQYMDGEEKKDKEYGCRCGNSCEFRGQVVKEFQSCGRKGKYMSGLDACNSKCDNEKGCICPSYCKESGGDKGYIEKGQTCGGGKGFQAGIKTFKEVLYTFIGPMDPRAVHAADLLGWRGLLDDWFDDNLAGNSLFWRPEDWESILCGGDLEEVNFILDQKASFEYVGGAKYNIDFPDVLFDVIGESSDELPDGTRTYSIEWAIAVEENTTFSITVHNCYRSNKSIDPCVGSIKDWDKDETNFDFLKSEDGSTKIRDVFLEANNSIAGFRGVNTEIVVDTVCLTYMTISMLKEPIPKQIETCFAINEFDYTKDIERREPADPEGAVPPTGDWLDLGEEEEEEEGDGF